MKKTAKKHIFAKKTHFFYFRTCNFHKKVYLNGIEDEIQASVAQLVEHHVANVIVAGSNPVSRSILYMPTVQNAVGFFCLCTEH